LVYRPFISILFICLLTVLDGFGLVNAIKEDQSLRTTPIILLTARAEDSNRAEGIVSVSFTFELAFDLIFPCNSSPELMVSAGHDLLSHLVQLDSITDYLSKPFSSKELLARANFQMQLGKRRREMEARFQSVGRCHLAVVDRSNEYGS
jgi:DNA-binding response OmpR family regulator